MSNLNVLDWLALILVLVGALNWGLVGILDFNVVTALFGASIITKIVYIVVGVSALYVGFIATRLGKK